jgi:hypothetical protein
MALEPVTSAGRGAALAAQPVHAAAVRRHLIEPLSRRERDSPCAILGHLSDPD